MTQDNGARALAERLHELHSWPDSMADMIVEARDILANGAAFLEDAAELERLRRIEAAARTVVSTEDQFVQTYAGADGKAADAAMGYLRTALAPEGSAGTCEACARGDRSTHWQHEHPRVFPAAEGSARDGG